MKTALLLFFSLMTAPDFTWASQHAPLSISREACRCDSKVADPFEGPVAFGSGVNAGKCVDSCRFRRPRIISEARGFTVANVMHHGKAMIAEIDPSGAYQLDLIMEEFLPAISHVAFRVRFAPSSPIRLRSQMNPDSPSFEESHDLVISVEAALPVQEKFTFNNARSGAFILNYRLITIEEARRWMVDVQKHSVRQFQLAVPHEALPKLVELAVRQGQDRSFEEKYFLFTSNCSSQAFEMLDLATGAQSPSGLAWLERAWPVAGLYGTLHYLQSRGLIQRELPALGQEN